jgi:hypothetical protein
MNIYEWISEKIPLTYTSKQSIISYKYLTDFVAELKVQALHRTFSNRKEVPFITLPRLRASDSSTLR